jgi:hypothetical protein
MGGIEKAVEGGAADAEHAGGADLVAIGEGEDAGDVTKDGAVKIRVVTEVVGAKVGGGSGRGWGGPLESGDVEGPNPLARTLQGGGGDNRLELAKVPGPRMGGEAAEGAGGKAAEELAMVEAPLAEEKAGEEGEVVTAVAQRREEEADGGEMTGEIGTKDCGGGETAQGLQGADDGLARSGNGKVPEALVSGAFEEVAEEALLLGRELVNAGKVEESASGVLPESLRGQEKIGGEGGDKRAGGGGTEAVERLRGKKLAGSGLAFDGNQTKMWRGAAHAGEELLHGEAAAGHGAEHPFFGLEGLGFEGLDVDRFSQGERTGAGGFGSENIWSEGFVAIGNHSLVHPAAGDIGKRRGRIKRRRSG